MKIFAVILIFATLATTILAGYYLPPSVQYGPATAPSLYEMLANLRPGPKGTVIHRVTYTKPIVAQTVSTPFVPPVPPKKVLYAAPSPPPPPPPVVHNITIPNLAQILGQQLISIPGIPGPVITQIVPPAPLVDPFTLGIGPLQ